MKSLGEFTTEVAIAVQTQDFYYLKSLLATAYEDYDDHEHKRIGECLESAIAPLAPENKAWFKQMERLMRSGGEPDG